MSNQDRGELKGTDAPGFGERPTGGEVPAPETAPAESRIVAEEFTGMDNDLIDMGSFGEGGTGQGTQTGGAGEKLRPVADDGEDVDETSAGGLDYPAGVPTSGAGPKS